MRREFGIGRMMLVIVALTIASVAIRPVFLPGWDNWLTAELLMVGAAPMTIAIGVGAGVLGNSRGRPAVLGFVVGQVVALLVFLGLISLAPGPVHRFFLRLVAGLIRGPGYALAATVGGTILGMQSAVAFVGLQVARILLMTGRIAPGPDAPAPR